MFKNLKQKWESEKVETSSLSSDSDPSQALQFDESSTNNHKNNSNSNLSIVSESDGKRFFKSNGSNTNESILKWMMNKTSSSSQDLTSLNQRTNPTTNLPSLLRPTSRSSVTLNESSTTVAIDKSDSSSEVNLQLENTRLREQVKELTRKLESHLSAAVKNEKPLDQIDDKLLKMVAELMVKESSEDKQQQPKESNNSSKSTSGNWSFLTLPPVNKAEIDDQHKQEIDKLQKRINELEETLREKNKTIRLQQQRINDIKKSFQIGSTLDNKLFDLPGNDSESTTDGSPSNNLTPRSENGFTEKQMMIQPNNHSNHHLHLHHQRQLSDSQPSSTCPMNDISWQYLRSVIFKFVLTSDYEAQKHLVKVIAMILQFSDAEEKQIKDSLKQKVSWFKSLPLLGSQIKHHHSNLNHH